MKTGMKCKLILINIMIFAASAIFSGCWDITELNQIVLVMGIGIDKIPGVKPIQVTLEIVSPETQNKSSEKSERASASIIQTSQGKTLFEAIENLSRGNAVKLDFSHNLIVILSKELCQSGVTEPIDYIRRNIPFRMTSWILVSNRTAKEVLKSKISGEDITSIGINKMMRLFNSNGYLSPVILNEYFVESGSVAKSSYLPLIDIENSDANLQGKISIEKMAILKSDHFIGILSNQESRILMWLLNKHKGSVLIYPFEPDESVSMEVSEVSGKIVPYISDGQFHFKIICRGKAYLMEMKNMKMDPETLKKIEQNAESVLKNQFNELIDKSQKEFNTDFIGFSKAIHNEAPQEWFAVEKNWDEIYPELKYEIDFKVDMTNIGLIKNSELTSEEKEEKK